MKVPLRLVLLLLLWSVLGVAQAEKAPDEKVVAALVGKLGDEEFAVREKAEKELEAFGEPVLEPLRKFRGHPDPEVRGRIKQLISRLMIEGNELEWIDPKNEANQKFWSEMGGAGTRLVFKNVSRQSVRIYWLEPDGSRRVWRGILEPGEEAVCQRSYRNHTWVVTDLDENALGLYRIDREEPVLVVRDRLVK